MKYILAMLLLLNVPLGKEQMVKSVPTKVTVSSQPVILVGVASYYGEEWTVGHAHRGIMANGRPFNPRKLTAASYVLPLGAHVRVRNLSNNKVVDVVITDRGPAKRLHRLIDLSEAGAEQLGYTHQGITKVAIEQ